MGLRSNCIDHQSSRIRRLGVPSINPGNKVVHIITLFIVIKHKAAHFSAQLMRSVMNRVGCHGIMWGNVGCGGED